MGRKSITTTKMQLDEVSSMLPGSCSSNNINDINRPRLRSLHSTTSIRPTTKTSPVLLYLLTSKTFQPRSQPSSPRRPSSPSFDPLLHTVGKITTRLIKSFPHPSKPSPCKRNRMPSLISSGTNTSSLLGTLNRLGLGGQDFLVLDKVTNLSSAF